MNPFYPWGRPEHKRAKSDSGHTYAYGYPPYQPYHGTPLYTTTPLPVTTHLHVPGQPYLSPVSPPWATPALPSHSPPVVATPLPPPGWDPAYAWAGGYHQRSDSPPAKPKPVIGELLSTADTYRHIIWDVRTPPSEAEFYHYARDRTVPLPKQARDDLATSPAVRKMTLLCKHLPWKIEVTNPSGITYGDILEHIYQNLQAAMTYGEWWIADEKKRNKIMEEVRSGKPGKARREADGTHKVKKVDWLSDHTALVGLGKDRRLMDERFIAEGDRETTWSIELGKPGDD